MDGDGALMNWIKRKNTVWRTSTNARKKQGNKQTIQYLDMGHAR
jgi:hypothetical protein